MDLFGRQPVAQPLAARCVPPAWTSTSARSMVLAPGKPLREALEQGALHSMIFWGAARVGKTTLARLLAKVTDAHFETISAVLSGVKEIRQAVEVGSAARGAVRAGAPSSSSTKCTASTRASRTPSCLTWKTAR